MRRCWFCGKADGDLVAYAMVETPTRHLFDGHAECATRNGIGGELCMWKPKEGEA